MAKNLKCSHCDNAATVHLTQIVNNKIIKVDLCDACAQAKGVTDPEGFSLADLLNKTNLISEKEDVQLECGECGLSTADFRRTGRLGCASCYQTFSPLVRPVLEDMHAGSQHKGKVPNIALTRQHSQAELETLENALQRAVAEEAYEEAAKFRDQIQSIKDSAASEAVHS